MALQVFCARCRSTIAVTSFTCRWTCSAALQVTPEEFFHLEKNDDRLAAALRQTALRARDHFLAARDAARPGAALAAVLPAALVPVYLRKLGRDVPIHRRQMALLSAAMRRRL